MTKAIANDNCSVLSIVNQKGGVGKTTTAINLATALAAVGKRVLLVDLDPQGNASTGLGVENSSRKRNIYHVLCGNAVVSDVSRETLVPNLHVVPSTVDLSAAEIELLELDRREFSLAEALQPVKSSYDYIIIDCPPSLGLLTINALVAAASIMIPLQCEFFALEGLSHLLRTVDRVKQRLNPALSIRGVVLTMYDKRNNLTEQVELDVRECLGSNVYQTVIPRNIRVSEAPSHGKPAIVYDLRCSGSRAYMHLAKEMLRRELVA